MASGDTKTQEYLNLAATGTRADLPGARGCCNTRTQDLIVDVADRIITEEETRAREDAILQGEIDEIRNNPDVFDIVPTYAALQAYDTSVLTDKDIIRVLQDETHQGASTFYRWSASTNTFTYVGEAGDYYTRAQSDALLATKADKADTYTKTEVDNALDLKADKATTYTKTEVDTALSGKQDTLIAGTNITIGADGKTISATDTTYTAGTNVQINGTTISATDTTYSDFTGTDGATGGAAGLVPAPAATDADKFLKSDGTWATAGGGSSVNVVQTTGTSTTDVMSQNATTGLVYADPGTNTKIKIGDHASDTEGTNGIEIGHYAKATGARAIAIGGGDGIWASAQATGEEGVAVGGNAFANTWHSVAIGSNATSTSGFAGVAIGSSASAANMGVAIGANANATVRGQFDISAGINNEGYNNTNYRLITGLHDGQSAHDAVTVGQVNSVIDSINAALNTSIPHIGA